MEASWLTLLLICWFKLSISKLFTLEMEHFSLNAVRMARSEASGNFSVWLGNGDIVELEFCLQTASFVSIRNINYSNDGPSDELSVSIDRLEIGLVRTVVVEEHGNGWNIFRSSGPLAERRMLQTGRHLISIQASLSDKYGVEVDNVLLNIDDDHIEYTEVMCKSYCFNVKYNEVPRKDAIPTGRFVQKSTSTLCAEQDNVKIQIFHDSVNDFEITANLPKYVSFANFRDPNYDNCMLSKPFWLFLNHSVAVKQADVSTKEGALLRFLGSAYKTILMVTFNFKKITPIREADERFTGTVLTLILKNLSRENVIVSLEYIHNNSWKGFPEKEFTPFVNEYSWNFSANIWRVDNENQIKITIEPGKQNVIVDTLRLDRQIGSDSFFDMYADADVVFQGVRLSFWHHWSDHPLSMTVTVQDGRNSTKYTNVDSLRIYSKVPWTGGFSQVFVLFQDGRTRLQALTPHGLDFVPFGASVNIGQPMFPEDMRPYSPINMVTVDPKGIRMVVQYEDGNKATMVLRATFTETKLIVKEILFNKNRAVHPIMTFQSMWVHDGNADTDHVSINGDFPHHIISEFKELYGISAVFFRKCISQHNTQGPDIKIKLITQS